MRKILSNLLMVGVVGALGQTAAADDDIYDYSWNAPELQSGIGVAVFGGGGIGGFTDSTMRNVTSDIQGLWNVRATFGSHIPIGLDIGYVGTAQNVHGFNNNVSGHLLGTALEGALHVNLLPHYIVNPYLFAGLGWQRYDVTGETVTLSDSGMNSSDNLLTVPMGAGLQWRSNGFVLDVRGVFRATTENNLVLVRPFDANGNNNSFAPMHTWEASGALGFEF